MDTVLIVSAQALAQSGSILIGSVLIRMLVSGTTSRTVGKRIALGFISIAFLTERIIGAAVVRAVAGAVIAVAIAICRAA